MIGLLSPGFLAAAAAAGGSPGVAEVVTIAASGLSDTTSDNHGNSVSLDEFGTYALHTTAMGWSSGSPSGPSVTFTKDDVGDVVTNKVGGNGTVTVDVEGVDPS
ncbi:MAG: hypothetical protein JNK76_20485 [Planctomycetales bacterium]|nr:hypothetical protein [Planctomycetales bacterium]